MTKKPLYVCAICSQDFTRRSNANRHKQNIHLGNGEIVRFLEYLIGRSSGKYLPSDPLSFRPNRFKKNNSVVHEYESFSNGKPDSNTNTNNTNYRTEYRQNRINDSTTNHINSSVSNKTTFDARNNRHDMNNFFQMCNKVDEFLQKQRIKEKLEDIEGMLCDFHPPEIVGILVTDLHNRYNATTDYRGFYKELENYRNNLVNCYLNSNKF